MDLINKVLSIAPKITNFLVIFAVINFLVPPLSTITEHFVAWRFGVQGWVYYEVGINRSSTEHSSFFLLREGKANYKEVGPFDKLQANTTVFFRSEPSKEGEVIFTLDKGSCVTIISFPNHPVEVKKAQSGGWLNVSTINCALFR